ncbi:hypothetical protein OAT07_05250 [Candidatus Pelagibacter sp.]|nr:hypothetical protein [Candidatus Pelagibacter sp.]
MNKIYLILILIFLLTSCAAPGSALLSPVITGAKTKSSHQATLSLVSSLSSNQIIKENTVKINEVKKKITDESKKTIKKISSTTSKYFNY